MIENIFDNMTPHIVNGKKLYDEGEIKKAVRKLVDQIYNNPGNGYSLAFDETVKKEVVEQFPEATC